MRPLHVTVAAGEFDAFLARAARGRNELELTRRDETEKRQNRFRALVQVRRASYSCTFNPKTQLARPSWRTFRAGPNPVYAGMHCVDESGVGTGSPAAKQPPDPAVPQPLQSVHALCVAGRTHALTHTLLSLLLLLLQEVDGLHRLELLHLQAYLDSAQAVVSPYTPLRDTNLKRKRELLGLQV